MTREEEIQKRLFEISTSNFNSAVDYAAYQAGYLDGIKWADSHPHWISVEDKLPKDKSWIIVSTVQNSMACPAYYYEGEDIEELRSQGITHWMPLPKMPVLSNSENTGKNEKGE